MTDPRRAVFLDRDGTLNEERGYLYRIDDFRWLPGAIDAIRDLRRGGWRVVVVTNQAGVGRGYYTEADVAALHAHLQAGLAEAGAAADAIYYCPHPPGAGCRCRKPDTGLFEQAAGDLDLDLGACVAVGDKLSDLLPGLRLGCRTVMVLTGYGPSELAKAAAAGARVDHVAADLRGAADWILAQGGRA